MGENGHESEHANPSAKAVLSYIDSSHYLIYHNGRNPNHVGDMVLNQHWHPAQSRLHPTNSVPRP